MRYQFLKDHRDEFGTIRKACEILGVQKSGFYELLGRRKSDEQIEREALERFMKDEFERHGGRYSYRRINHELRRTGIYVSEKHILSAMRKLGLQAKGATRRHRRARAVEKGDPHVNLINRAFGVDPRNRLWVGDITCIPTD